MHSLQPTNRGMEGLDQSHPQHQRCQRLFLMQNRSKRYHSIPWWLHILQKWQQWQSKVCLHLKLDQSHHSLEVFVCQPGLWSVENHPAMATSTSIARALCFGLSDQLCRRFTGFLTKSPSLGWRTMDDMSCIVLPCDLFKLQGQVPSGSHESANWFTLIYHVEQASIVCS